MTDADWASITEGAFGCAALAQDDAALTSH